MLGNIGFIVEAFDEHAIVSMTDAAGNITYVNQKFIDISGYSREELLGKNHRMLKSGIHPRPFYDQMWDTLLSGKTWHGEMCNRRRNGDFYWVRASIKPVLDDNDLPLKYISIRTDITEVKLAEEAEHRSRMLLRSVIDTIPDLIFFKDKDRFYLGCNHAFEQYLGVTEDQIIGRTNLDFLHRNMAVFSEIDKRMLASGQAQLSEELLCYPDGRKVWWEVLKKPYHYGDKTPGVIGIAHDITERRKLQSAMKRHEQVLETAMDGFWMTNNEGVLEEVNEAYARMSGYSMQELVGMHISQLEANESPEEVAAHVAKIIAQGSDRFETGHRRRDSRTFDLEISATFMPECRKFFVFGHDITQRKQAEEALRIAAATFETHDGIVITDAHANIIRVNRAFTEITGYTAAEALGKNPRFMNSGKHDRAFYIEMWQQLLHTGVWSGEIWDKRKNGEIYPKWMTISAVKNEHQETAQYVAIFSDITERKLAEDEIRNLAFYDPLTRLPNRRLFIDRLCAALPASERHGDYGAVMFIDMDQFKLLNDTLGHECGDLMLIEVARRIKSCVREMDTVARLGGDEFVVLIEALDGGEQDALYKVAAVAEKIRNMLAHPYHLPEHLYHSSPSIGVALYQGNRITVDTLLRRADLAMYQIKHNGRNGVKFYEPSMQKQAT